MLFDLKLSTNYLDIKNLQNFTNKTIEDIMKDKKFE